MITLLALIVTATYLLTFALVMVFVLRPLVRHFFGSVPVYALWAIPVVVSCIACFAPWPGGPRILTTGAVGSDDVSRPALEMGPEGLAVLAGCWMLGVVIAGAITYLRQRSFRLWLEETIHAGSVAEIPIFISASLAGPIARGILSKSIVLPESFEKLYSAEVQGLILSHELAHLRRHDPLANLLAQTLACFFWFHPLVYWANYYMRLDQELACDEIVLRSAPDQRRSYGEALLKVALSDAPAIGWHSSTAQVKKRITVLTKPFKPKAVRNLGLALTTISLLLAGVVSLGLLPQGPPRYLDATEHMLLVEDMSPEELGINLLHAVQHGNFSLAERLLSHGAPIEFTKPEIGTPLILAAKQGQLGLVKLLVASKANVNAAVLTAGSPLIMAAKHDRREVAAFLIDQGSDVNAHVFFDETPLINAARFGHVDMVERLVDAGAAVHKSVTTFSITHLPLGTKSPMSEAQRAGHADVVSLLESMES